MKVFFKSVRSRQPQCHATALINTETGKEVFRVNYWRNDTAEMAADKALSDWIKKNGAEVDEYPTFFNS